jgi:hypothetical protein
MRKITKPAVVCDKCGSELIPERHDHFCDNCEMKTSKDTLNVEIYWKDGNRDAETLEFCCLKCVREWLLSFPYNKEEVQFVVLPYISNLDDLQIFLNDNKGGLKD